MKLYQVNICGYDKDYTELIVAEDMETATLKAAAMFNQYYDFTVTEVKTVEGYKISVNDPSGHEGYYE